MKNESTPLRILVVDDDALSREVLALLLEHAGYIVSTADSGDAAVHKLGSTPSPTPDVILADFQMPGITGGALARALRECSGRSLLLAMSGSHLDDDLIREFDGLLLKPFSMEELAAAIASARNHVEAAPSETRQHSISLDMAIYDKLSASMRAERLQQLYTLFLTDTDQRVTHMRKLASNRDDALIRKEAHAIKGSAGMVGAIELQTLAAQLEEDGLRANHEASLDELMVACERLSRILMARHNM
jgi:Response regulators consisting of a CheY-like receiver domain and a winged-helix DNA-binding domain